MLSLQTKILVAGLINQARDGRIFTAKFVKKNGEIRMINARLGVKKGVTGTGKYTSPLQNGMLRVYDMQKRAFRTLNVDTMLELKMNGQTYDLW